MSRCAYVNGAFCAWPRARVSIEDRGFQFADAIYEVWGVRAGRLLDLPGHLARYHRSMAEIRMAAPMSDAALLTLVKETMRRNRVRDGIVYLQVSRGAAPRDHAFPAPATRTTLVITAKNLDQRALAARAANGVSIITAPEARWARCDIKSVNLLPNVLAKQAAREAGAFEAWFVDDAGLITEGTSSTAWIVDAQGRVRTRELSHRILPGITRAVMLSLARERQMQVCESAFSPADVAVAREAFLTSASNIAVPVVAIDGKTIGDGKPGPVAKALRAIYFGAQAAPG